MKTKRNEKRDRSHSEERDETKTETAKWTERKYTAKMCEKKTAGSTKNQTAEHKICQRKNDTLNGEICAECTQKRRNTHI